MRANPRTIQQWAWAACIPTCACPSSTLFLLRTKNIQPLFEQKSIHQSVWVLVQRCAFTGKLNQSTPVVTILQLSLNPCETHTNYNNILFYPILTDFEYQLGESHNSSWNVIQRVRKWRLFMGNSQGKILHKFFEFHFKRREIQRNITSWSANSFFQQNFILFSIKNMLNIKKQIKNIESIFRY